MFFKALSPSRSLFVLLVFIALEGPLWADNPAGLITKVQGRVTVRLTGEEKTTPVKVGDPVLVGHWFQTEKGAKAQLVFADNSLITILPESDLRINQYAYSSLEKRTRAIIQVFNGQMRFIVNKREINQAGFTIETRQASISAAVSDFMVKVSSKETEVAVLADGLTVKNILPLTVGVVRLDTNQKTVVREKVPPERPTIGTLEQRRKYISDTDF